MVIEIKDKIEELKKKVEKWRDYFYHEVDGHEESADEMMNELLNEIRELKQLHYNLIKSQNENNSNGN